MVSISKETIACTHARLHAVIAAAEFISLDGTYTFEELGRGALARANPEALAVVRDEDGWSQLVPRSGGSGEQFGISSFHFAPNLDNSGFVGWLATHLKRRLGTGLAVICGYNASRGGIYDYWCYPIDLRVNVLKEIERLRHRRTRPATAL